MAKDFSDKGSFTGDKTNYEFYKVELSNLDPNGSTWAYYELVYDGVRRVRELEAKLWKLKADTIESLQQMEPHAD